MRQAGSVRRVVQVAFVCQDCVLKLCRAPVLVVKAESVWATQPRRRGQDLAALLTITIIITTPRGFTANVTSGSLIYHTLAQVVLVTKRLKKFKKINFTSLSKKVVKKRVYKRKLRTAKNCRKIFTIQATFRLIKSTQILLIIFLYSVTKILYQSIQQFI